MPGKMQVSGGCTLYKYDVSLKVNERKKWKKWKEDVEETHGDSGGERFMANLREKTGNKRKKRKKSHSPRGLR